MQNKIKLNKFQFSVILIFMHELWLHKIGPDKLGQIIGTAECLMLFVGPTVQISHQIHSLNLIFLVQQ